MWEKVRSAKPAQAKLENEKLLKLIKGKIADVVFKHDASRIIQTCLKLGTPEQRTIVFNELKDHVGELCRNRYASFLMNKLIKYCDKTQRSLLVSKLSGKVTKMLRNADSAAVIQYVYSNDAVNARQKRALLKECYGPQFQMLQVLFMC